MHSSFAKIIKPKHATVACAITTRLFQPFSVSAPATNNPSHLSFDKMASLVSLKLGWEATPAALQVAVGIERILTHYSPAEISILSLTTIKNPIDLFKIAETVEEKYVAGQWLARADLAVCCSNVNHRVTEIKSVQQVRAMVLNDQCLTFCRAEKTEVSNIASHLQKLTNVSNTVSYTHLTLPTIYSV